MALISYMVEVPVTIRLRLDSLKIERAVGGMVATTIRRQLRAGFAPGGKRLATPKDHGKPGSTSRAPLYRTGQLIKSIRYSRSGGYVGPSGVRREGAKEAEYGKKTLLVRKATPTDDNVYAERGSRRVVKKRNYAVLAILVRSFLQPSFEVDDDLARKMSAKAEEAIARQLQRPGFGLQAELKRISRGYR